MKKENKIGEFMEQNLDTAQIVNVWNAYCMITKNNNAYCYNNDEETLNNIYGKRVKDLLVGIHGGEYDVNNKYFIIDEFEKVYSFSNAYSANSPIDIRKLAKWLAEEQNINVLAEFASVCDLKL